MAVVASFGWCEPSFAYRPFDGTDAATADYGEVEIELQPFGALLTNSEKTLIGPAPVFNYGFAEGWEAVLQGQLETPLSPAGSERITTTYALLKHVLLPGCLQDQPGPSIATEFGLLLPGINADSGIGGSLAGIISQRYDWGTIHFNLQAQLTRDQHADLFVGAIIEGPASWKLRPVSEFYYENEIQQVHTVSGLVGLIYQASDTVAFDVAFREALVNDRPVSEIRAGVTFGFSTLPQDFVKPDTGSKR